MAFSRQGLLAAALAVCALLSYAHPVDETPGALAVPTSPGAAVAIDHPAAHAVPTPGPAVEFEVAMTPVVSEAPSDYMASPGPEGSATPMETAAVTAVPVATEAMAIPPAGMTTMPEEGSPTPMMVETTMAPTPGVPMTNATAPVEEMGPVVVDSSAISPEDTVAASQPPSAMYAPPAMMEITPVDTSAAPAASPGTYDAMVSSSTDPQATPYAPGMYATPTVQYSTQPVYETPAVQLSTQLSYPVDTGAEWNPDDQEPKPVWQPGGQESPQEWQPDVQQPRPIWKPEDEGEKPEWTPEEQGTKPVWQLAETSKQPEWQPQEPDADQHWPDTNPSSPPSFDGDAEPTAVPMPVVAVPVPEEGHVPVSPHHGGPSVIIEISGPDSMQATPVAITAMPIPHPEDDESDGYWTPSPQPLWTQQPSEEEDKDGGYDGSEHSHDEKEYGADKHEHSQQENPVSPVDQKPHETPQPQWVSPEDAACDAAYAGCRFNFVGVKGLQDVNLGSAAPTWISHALAIKMRGTMKPRILNANNLVPEFVYPDGAQPITNFADPKLDPLAIRTVSKRGDRSVLMHGQLAGNQEEVLKGKCVRVFFSAYELIGQGGRSIGVRHIYRKEKGECVVFRIAR